MLKHRNWILRTSIFVNAVVLFYFAAYYTTTTKNGYEFTDDNQVGNVPSGELAAYLLAESTRPGLNGTVTALSSPTGPQSQSILIQGTTLNTQLKTGNPSTTLKATDASPEATSRPRRSLRDIIGCNDKTADYRIAQKGDFWALYNYATANTTFRCHESVTYTTHADYTFLDNLLPLVERWRGPISLALYAPGTDFEPTLASVRYLRDCVPLARQYVTFHVYFEAKHLPKSIPRPERAFNESSNSSVDCSSAAPWTKHGPLYRARKKLLYPVNVGRNVARDAALTHYILASDIELYPSPGVIDDFLAMVERGDQPLHNAKPKVFPLSLFEVESYASPPATKSQLVSMLKNGSAITFHKHVCPDCHTVPKGKEWINAPINPGLHVFHVAKRKGRWEPIFIGTNLDPYYDERLSWEGRSDKMTQGYALCVMDYEFQILDNAFLIHRPGIKRYKPDRARAIISGKTQMIIKRYSYPELKIFYGSRKGCIV